jgi:dipeptidyl aminopeptidase/acylaminoacyl peptidase
VALVLVATAGYAAASVYVYDRLSSTVALCPGTPPNDPTSFVVEGIDTAPYVMPPAQSVMFPARGDPAVIIDAWWEPAATPDAPTIVLVHGHNGCKRDGANLLAAGMLHRHGMAVLLIDLRNHGDSTVQDGRFAGGNDEYLDVLGAFDWLRSQGVPDGRVGLLGFSLGAATVMIAMGEDQEVGAVWADSSYADVTEAIRDELARNGYPTFLDVGGVLVGRLLTGDDLAARSPLEATAKLHGRPIFLTMGSDDERLDPRYLASLAEGVRAAGGIVDPWQVQGAGHTHALTSLPDEYERRLVDFFGSALGGT